jgi:polyphosphate kinase
MPRNFFRRIEADFPIEDPRLRRRIKSELLAIPLADNVKAWFLHADGLYRRAAQTGPAVRSQAEFIQRAARGGRSAKKDPNPKI